MSFFPHVVKITKGIGTARVRGGQIGAWSALAGFVGQPLPEARHHAIRAVTFNPPLLGLFVARQINVFGQRCPLAHPLVNGLALAIAGQRLKPIDVIAIHLIQEKEWFLGSEKHAKAKNRRVTTKWHPLLESRLMGAAGPYRSGSARLVIRRSQLRPIPDSIKHSWIHSI